MLARFKNQYTDLKVGSIPVLKPFEFKQKQSEDVAGTMFILVPYIKMAKRNTALKCGETVPNKQDKSHRYEFCFVFVV